MSEFIIHGTSIENLTKILNDKYIKIKPNTKNIKYISYKDAISIGEILFS